MGSGSSIAAAPDHIDKAFAEQAVGAGFDATIFDAVAGPTGLVEKKSLEVIDETMIRTRRGDIIELAPAAPAPPARRRVCVGVDGSASSHRAFKVAMTFVGASDHIDILNITDASKEWLPPEHRPEQIESYFEVELTAKYGVAKERYNFGFEPKRERETRAALMEWVRANAIDLLVVGFEGRKGVKEDPTCIGSSASYSLHEAPCTSVIVKKTSPVTSALLCR